ncbi:hypothetical protein E3U23_05925 [Erythrobacter litoralis]|uniref:hypothetical protein n=1 Tax=Erythrobacter litoralis TaxID=39960 RepID=UPI00243550F8|nr:hypothetical protein [Erythrobacter litoralis]MDG6078729.1 hypothetical protein [Erythrobacter litoralis]
MQWAEPDFLLFASDAAILALWGLGAVLIALAALVMEHRRNRRTRIDHVGWVPWTGIFLAFAVIGGGLLVAAIPPLLAG